MSLILSVVPVLLALSWGGRDYAWGSPLILSILGFGLFMTAMFFWIETRAPQPIIPLHLFREQIVWSSMAVSALVAIGMFGTTLFIPLFIQTVIGTSATKSGAVMMPMTLTLVVSAVLTGQIITRLGRYRALAVLGTAITGFAMYLLSQMGMETPYATVVRNLILMGLGLGATMPVFTLAVQNVVALKFVGVATSTVQFVRAVGGSLGAAIFGSLLANLYLPAFRLKLPADVAAQIPVERLAEFNNPQMLSQPHAFENLQNSFKGMSANFLPDVQLAARQGLAASLHTVFLSGACLLAIATLLAVLVKDIPLRKTNRPAPPVLE